MEWYINDLSLDGQFKDPRAFKKALEPLLQFRAQEPLLKDRLYCSMLLHERPITAKANLHQSVIATKDKTFIRLVLEWVSRSGTFWEENRQPNIDDYFEYKTHDVTDQGLGEAARRKLTGFDACTFSFKESSLSFDKSPLSVQHGLSELPIGYLSIENYWETSQLTERINSSFICLCWSDVEREIIRRFKGLIFTWHVMEALASTPFSKYVTERIFELLRVLDQLALESDEKGEISEKGKELYNNHFIGEKAWFTDESLHNKNNFKQKMTFPDPSDPNQKIFCPWHGKIKTPQIRIHFQWPRPKGQRPIKVLYIGPKITKS